MTDNTLTATLHAHRVQTNGITLHVMTGGPDDAPPVLLLHGFPEFWYGWRGQIDALVARGYRVVIPDQRGYNLSDRPAGVAAYAVDHLVGDTLGLIDWLGVERLPLVAHDWGAMVAWFTALRHPDRLDRLVIMNVPHPRVFEKALRDSTDQKLKSWYAFFFQIPALPEALLSMGGYAGFARTIQRSGNPGSFSDADLARYREAWAQPGAMTAMLNWYRALVQYRPARPDTWRVMVPTLMIWGARDHALSAAMAQPSIDLCDDGRLVMIPDATHWVQHDAREQVNALLTDFL